MATAPMVIVGQSPDIIPGAGNVVDARPVEAAVLKLDAILSALSDIGTDAVRWMESAIAQANAFGPSCSRDDFEKLTSDDQGKGGISSGMQRALSEGRKTPSADQVVLILEGVSQLLAKRPHVAMSAPLAETSTDLSGSDMHLSDESSALSGSTTSLSAKAGLARKKAA